MSYIKTLKRIRNNKTNYRKRKAVLISKRNFVTIKVSNQNIHCQLIRPAMKGDVVLTHAGSKELAKYGWKGSLNNLSACFLVGLILGKKMEAKKLDSAILYTGKTSFTSKVAACLKGIAAAGIDIPLSEESLPAEDRVNGSHLSEYAALLKQDKVKYEKQFSKLIKNNLDPQEYSKHFEEIKSNILAGKFD
ncbi:50S ribosomal protein L18 [Candidatus Nitrosocosmicus franklandus]|uniref:Large ribosomal subunit protein uL18 n=1 Tax=Candidatus Nitrosocosmicus franklandianus TaxID=1798806 RepID=A0A484IE43_9ARCH|nr:50S ribosomal protein L18 [Candidatus Nitrosocosmicus franklandus]VFJ15077.1 50S ribosomal protein L18 [Candidatus Nitrosocosmicus franklandus]